MNYSLIQRIKNWMCRMFGHKVFREALTEIEVCKRCNRLLSTRYSREKESAAVSKKEEQEIAWESWVLSDAAAASEAIGMTYHRACFNAGWEAALADAQSVAAGGGLDQLEYVMTLVNAATPGTWLWSDNGNIVPEKYTDDCEIAAVYSERDDDTCPINASAIIAAVNWLRQYGPAIIATQRGDKT